MAPMYEELASQKNPHEYITEDIWEEWRKQILQEGSGDVSLAELATQLDLWWPTGRRMPLSNVLGYSLKQLISLRGLGAKRLKTIILCVAYLASQSDSSGQAALPDESIDRAERILDFDYLASLEKPYERITDRTWNVWRAQLTQGDTTALRIFDVALTLGLKWPFTSRMRQMRIEEYLTYDLWQLINLRGLGEKKLRTIILVVAYLVSQAENGKLVVVENEAKENQKAQAEKAQAEQAARVEHIFIAIEEAGAEEEVDTLISSLNVALVDYSLVSSSSNSIRQRKILSARVGLEGSISSLEEIGREVDLTRERVRQIIARHGRRFQIEMPSWCERLSYIYRKLQRSGASEEVLRRLYHTLIHFVGVDRGSLPHPSKTLVTFVEACIREAYKNDETPMDLEVLGHRVNRSIQGPVEIEAVRRTAQEGGFYLETDEGEFIYFASSRESIHRALMLAYGPLSVDEIASRTDLSRTVVHSSLGNDPRLLQIEGGRWTILRNLPIVRENGFIKLPVLQVEEETTSDGEISLIAGLMDSVFSSVTPTSVTKQHIINVELNDLCHRVHNRLAARGIYNVTVHGFHRCCSEVLAGEYSSALEDKVSPVVLGQIAVEYTDTFVIGGKRRVALASFSNKANSQDNLYWLNRVLDDIATPCVPDDVYKRLESYYQDGPRYLHSMWLEYYGDRARFDSFSHPVHTKMSIIVPHAWTQNSDQLVTPAVRSMVNTIVRYKGRYSDLRRSDFDEVPWMCDLIDEASTYSFPWTSTSGN